MAKALEDSEYCSTEYGEGEYVVRIVSSNVSSQYLLNCKDDTYVCDSEYVRTLVKSYNFRVRTYVQYHYAKRTLITSPNCSNGFICDSTCRRTRKYVAPTVGTVLQDFTGVRTYVRYTSSFLVALFLLVRAAPFDGDSSSNGRFLAE